MKPTVILQCGDCRTLLAALPNNSIHSIVTDPPYELSFMMKGWDASGIAYNVPMWQECLRVLKPGGHLLAFGGTRTYHRMVCAIEDAGFAIRDSIHWFYGSGFPKSRNISKAIDKAAGVEREVVGKMQRPILPNGRGHGRDANGEVINIGILGADSGSHEIDVTVPATPEAQQWDGWGTAVKPGHEPIVLARKPFTGTVEANVLAHGTGALNIDGCRIGSDDDRAWPKTRGYSRHDPASSPIKETQETQNPSMGRWPANVVFTHAYECEFIECVEGCPVAELDRQSGKSQSPPVGSMGGGSRQHNVFGEYAGVRHPNGFGDAGGASRFFYVAKASRREREAGCEDLPEVRRSDGREKDIDVPRLRTTARRNHHPTVKPIALMQYLCRLITPPNGIVLDPFVGSGSTGCAAVLEGFRFIGCDLDPAYIEIAQARIDHHQPVSVFDDVA